jgi:mono/diheme cytochrome c family protein
VASLASGRTVFEASCSPCHGEKGEGGHGGGPALTAATNRATVTRVITEGRNLMPAFARSLTPEQIRDVTAHVVEALPH